MAVFTDGFETGDFSLWTATAGTPVIVGAPVHHGSNAAQFDAIGDYCIETHGSYYNLLYHRWYFYYTGTLTSGQQCSLVMLRHDGGYWAAILYIYNDSGSYKLRLRYNNGATINTYALGTTVLSASTWYCVELKADMETDAPSNDGSYQVWLNGVSEIDNIPNCDTTIFSYNQIYFGEGDGAAALTVTQDCLVVDTSRINCESAVSIPVMMHHYNHHIHKIIRG